MLRLASLGLPAMLESRESPEWSAVLEQTALWLSLDSSQTSHCCQHRLT